VKKLFWISLFCINILSHAHTAVPQNTLIIIIVDNVIVDRLFIHDLDPNKIEKINVYKSKIENRPILDDLTQNGILEITLKEKVFIPKLNIKEAKQILKLENNAPVFLNKIKVNRDHILVTEDLLKRAKIIQLDKINGYQSAALSLESGFF